MEYAKIRPVEPQQYITVSELNRLFNAVLEESFPKVFFEGEISELTSAASGHLYGTLKDSAAEVRIIVWASSVRALKFKPSCGQAVRCHGRPNVYQKSGRLQVIVDKMFPAGEGLLQKKFLELKAKLEKEGLFAADRKRALPFLPRAIGVVTSASGAAIHDIMVKLRERMPQIPVYLADVRVQGEGAAQEIAAALSYFGESGLVDVIIAGRGGGSLEDLWAFNEEAVVRAIFACPVPVVSAVGHEVDVSLSDLAADARAPTPTAAAEMIVPRRDELLAKIAECERRLQDYQRWFEPVVQQVDELALKMDYAVHNLLKAAWLHISAAESKLKTIEPRRVLELWNLRLDALHQKLKRAFARDLNAASAAIEKHQGRLRQALSAQKIALLGAQVRVREGQLLAAWKHYIERAVHRVKELGARLDALNPRRVLERGYSLVEFKGKIISSAEELEIEDRLKILFAQGAIGAEVKEKM